jgi:hypothetical protein
MKMLQFDTREQLRAHLMDVFNMTEDEVEKALEHADNLKRIDEMMRETFKTYAMCPHTPEVITVVAASLRGIADIVENPSKWKEIHIRLINECENIMQLIGEPEGSA